MTVHFYFIVFYGLVWERWRGGTNCIVYAQKFGPEEFWPIATGIWKLDKVGVGGMYWVILLWGKPKNLDKDTCFPFENTKLMDGRAVTLEVLGVAALSTSVSLLLLELPTKLSEILNLPHNWLCFNLKFNVPWIFL